jgi:RNA polymerase sigma factor (sigma-70 family)
LDAVVGDPRSLAQARVSADPRGRRRVPGELRELLSSRGEDERSSAWERFLAKHSRLLMKVALETSRGYDGAMDRYTFTLECLRAEDFKRLRRYEPHSQAKFTTWLVVVARRLCLDHHRRVYGRPRQATDRTVDEHEVRRRLVDFVMEEVDPDTVVSTNGSGADAVVRARELLGALDAALGTLGPEERLLLRLRFEDEVPVSDIARILGVPTVFHVYRRIKKVLARLRSDLEARGVEGPTP